MCGIVGYIGPRPAAPLLIEGLQRLEYRGYDSAGICVLNDGTLQVRKLAGRVAQLQKVLKDKPIEGNTGIAHTRWATHGPPTDINAHPHLDSSKTIAVVHNGIIENYQALKSKLIAQGCRFISQTDSEVFAHLISTYLKKKTANGAAITPALLTEAVVNAADQATGTYAIVVTHAALPGVLVGARRGSPLVLGIGPNEFFLASDISPIIPYTDQVIFLEDGDVITVTPTSYQIYNNKRAVERPVKKAHYNPEEAEKGNFPHFMLKEIHEQPIRAAEVIKRCLKPNLGIAEFEELSLSPVQLRKIKRLLLVGCGTSWHAALTGEYTIESLALLPVEVENASEMRYRQRLYEKGTVVMAISQSGETADTLAAVRVAKAQGLRTLALVNVPGSTIARESDAEIYMRAGPEIGVASTKAMGMQLLILTLLGLTLARLRETIPLNKARHLARQLQRIPDQIQRILEDSEHIKRLAEKYMNYGNFLYLGRQYNYPIALEGALKLKEISYIHAEGYPSAEMKHGPIALITPEFPTVIIAPRDSVYEKNLNNIAEIKARNGRVIAVATEGDTKIVEVVDDVIYVPETEEVLYPLLTVVPLQLFAYYVAVFRGCDVDKPRNLAKSVTVE